MSTLYDELGLHPALNANGKMTALGGSRLSEPVIAAMGEAARGHVVMDELLAAAGRELARATGTEDACPTTGAASGIAIAVAALIAGTDLARIERLPDPADRPHEVVLQKGHAVHFGAPVRQMIALGGGTAVEAGAANKVRREHLESAITDRTVALLHVQSHHAVRKGMLPLAETVAVAHAHGLPVILDAAAEDDLRAWPRTGADLVIYSGGKAIGGPTSGLICGPAPLIEACRAQYAGIARPMKVGKETVLGLVRAVREHTAHGAGAGSREERDAQRDRMARLAARLGTLPGVTADVVRDEAGRDIHRARLTVDPDRAGRDAAALGAELRAGTPPVFLRDHLADNGVLAIDPRSLTPDEEEVLAQRLTHLLDGKGEMNGNGDGDGDRDGAPGTDEEAGHAATVERRLKVTEEAGLHARPAAAFAQAAARTTAEVTVARVDSGTEGRPVPARSVLSVLTLSIRYGDEIVLRATGDDAEAVLNTLTGIAAPA
ncbi:DgaE family pyridoxal phosphate-dependent ammonia lyase [Streptomyces iconiensis]|uniref:DgaE family pyridoxal phosphate-dependent ammonia lyase n=1 Tax=Streptomyces iconiensis TaxID=1384038 RepID=UPI00321B2588